MFFLYLFIIFMMCNAYIFDTFLCAFFNCLIQFLNSKYFWFRHLFLSFFCLFFFGIKVKTLNIFFRNFVYCNFFLLHFKYTKKIVIIYWIRFFLRNGRICLLWFLLFKRRTKLLETWPLVLSFSILIFSSIFFFMLNLLYIFL